MLNPPSSSKLERVRLPPILHHFFLSNSHSLPIRSDPASIQAYKHPSLQTCRIGVFQSSNRGSRPSLNAATGCHRLTNLLPLGSMKSTYNHINLLKSDHIHLQMVISKNKRPSSKNKNPSVFAISPQYLLILNSLMQKFRNLLHQIARE